jgi:hypothetical protein
MLIMCDDNDHTKDLSAKTLTAASVGDRCIRLKVKLRNFGSNSALALISHVKVPTAPLGVGNGTIEDAVTAPLSFSLPSNIAILFNSEVNLLKNEAGDGRNARALVWREFGANLGLTTVR